MNRAVLGAGYWGLGARDSRLAIRESRFGPLLLAAFAILTLACKSEMTPTASEPFPTSEEVKGWVKSGDTRTFPAANLWEYIDGDAEKYLQAGVEQTLTADYRYQNQTEAVADIYVMKTPEGARKIFDSESAEGSQRISLGDDARLFPSTLSFSKGRYFVRLTAYQEAPENAKALTELARAIEKKLAAGG